MFPDGTASNSDGASVCVCVCVCLRIFIKRAHGLALRLASSRRSSGKYADIKKQCSSDDVSGSQGAYLQREKGGPDQTKSVHHVEQETKVLHKSLIAFIHRWLCREDGGGGGAL